MSGQLLNAAEAGLDVYEREQKFAWELRGHWAKRRPVVLTLTERCLVDRVEGLVEHVAVTGAFVEIAGWHVPLTEVTGIHRPHVHQQQKEA